MPRCICSVNTRNSSVLYNSSSRFRQRYMGFPYRRNILHTQGTSIACYEFALSLKIYTQLIYVYLIAYFPATGFTKLCFLFFFLRIFPVRRVERMIHVLIGCTAIYIVVFMTTMIFACKPISAMWTAWTKESTPSYCIDQKAFIYAGAGINIALDLAVCIIPIPELWKLNLTTRKKAFLVAIFSVGGM